METRKAIASLHQFFEQEYSTKLAFKGVHKEKRIVIDFNLLCRFDPELADFLLEDPGECLKAAEIAVKSTNDDLHKDFIVRVKNWPKDLKLDISQIRAKHFDKLMTVHGMIRQKSEIMAEIVSARFECPSCGNVMNVLQMESERKFAVPSMCPKCIRKSNFRLLSTEDKDMYRINIEEPADQIQGGQRLSNIDIMCDKDLADYEIEQALLQGGRVDITGVLKKKPVYRKGKRTGLLTKYIDALYIKIYDETFINLKWDEKEEIKFKELAKRPDWLQSIRESVFYDIVGFSEVCEGVLLQMFGGVDSVTEGQKKRGTFHVLLIGDPSMAKSTILEIATQFAPKAMYTGGTQATKTGLTGAAIKDELTGGWMLEAGPIVLCNRGILAIDELDKLPDEHKEGLLIPMEQGYVTIHKATIKATMAAKTSLLCAANPKHGIFSPYDDIFNQVNLDSTLLSRFDLVYPILDSLMTREEKRAIAKRIICRGQSYQTNKPEHDRLFLKKYIAYSKSINPQISTQVADFLLDKYDLLKHEADEKLARGERSAPITSRVSAAFTRMTEAVARSRLHPITTMDDAILAVDKVMHGIKLMGVDPESGEWTQTYEMEGKIISYKKADLAARLERLLREMASKEPVEEELIMEIMKSEGFDILTVEKHLKQMKESGDVYSPRPGVLKY